MADDTTVTTNDPGYEPEPIPDNIADTELNGLNPAEESTDSEQVEDEQEETQQDQQTDDTVDETDEDADDSGTPDEEEEPEADDDGQQQEEQPNQQEAARKAYQQRQQQRDYVTEQRQQIRQYEVQHQQKVRNGDLSEVEQLREEQRIINAKLWTDSVERNRQSVVNEGQRALSEIPLFKENTPQSQAVFSQSLQSFRQAYGVYDDESGELVATEDRNGNPVSLYQYLQQQAEMVEQARQDAQRQTQKAETKMRAKAVNPSNPGKVSSSGDELADLLDKIGDMPLN